MTDRSKGLKSIQLTARSSLYFIRFDYNGSVSTHHTKSHVIRQVQMSIFFFVYVLLRLDVHQKVTEAMLRSSQTCFNFVYWVASGNNSNDKIIEETPVAAPFFYIHKKNPFPRGTRSDYKIQISPYLFHAAFLHNLPSRKRITDQRCALGQNRTLLWLNYIISETRTDAF